MLYQWVFRHDRTGPRAALCPWWGIMQLPFCTKFTTYIHRLDIRFSSTSQQQLQCHAVITNSWLTALEETSQSSSNSCFKKCLVTRSCVSVWLQCCLWVCTFFVLLSSRHLRRKKDAGYVCQEADISFGWPRDQQHQYISTDLLFLNNFFRTKHP